MESIAIEARFYAVLLWTYMTGNRVAPLTIKNPEKEAGMRGKMTDMDVLFMGSLMQYREGSEGYK